MNERNDGVYPVEEVVDDDVQGVFRDKVQDGGGREGERARTGWCGRTRARGRRRSTGDLSGGPLTSFGDASVDSTY